ncbi:MAG: N-acetylglucosamine-6-phosphate deacetylase [Prosthecobacter sp.]|uniref:N-acetylglucosamine-6-phosphate deacetylase n=1 Tax=Prosthecobacter sp. TaxID=1965333 RepID=UPI00261359D0|nr:N-acetylglucosamine-6-phosphate deacetylase [Prosthecobacter sp.]MCF7789431.1 N-acetylglucosamine-6-phosphate deacetylase [Prosthecobacter sp.]
MKTPNAPPLLIQNGTLILPDKLIEGGAVLCERGKIKEVGEDLAAPKNAVVIDAKGGYISPGFIDIHVHGGAGADFMDGTVPAVRTALKAHALHGTTSIFPTTTTGAPVQIMAMLIACREAKRSWVPEHGSRIAGVHLYGPYFAADKVGCHSREGRREPDPEEYARWFRDDLVRIATCAAELPGAHEFYQMARKQRCLITCGHSNANWEEMESAYKAGMRHVDHFWCAMSSVASLRTRFGTPMQASMEQFVLATAEMSTEVIADGMHLAPELLDFAFRMKGVQRLCLVTDSNRAMDMPPGRYRFGSEDDGDFFESDGRVGFVPGQGLASSVMGLDHMVRHMKKSTSATLPDAVRMASLTPAERTGMAKTCGSLEKGKLADVLVLNRRLEVQRTFISGVEVLHD